MNCMLMCWNTGVRSGSTDEIATANNAVRLSAPYRGPFELRDVDQCVCASDRTESGPSLDWIASIDRRTRSPLASANVLTCFKIDRVSRIIRSRARGAYLRMCYACYACYACYVARRKKACTRHSTSFLRPLARDLGPVIPVSLLTH